MGGSAGRNGRLCGGSPPPPSEQRILTHSIRHEKQQGFKPRRFGAVEGIQPHRRETARRRICRIFKNQKTMQQLQKRRNDEFVQILRRYADQHDSVICWRNITPYCIRVYQRLKSWGSVWEPGELKPKRALIYSGVRRQILDLYPLGLKFHALRFNRRGIIRGRWEDKINQLINMTIQDDNTNDL